MDSISFQRRKSAACRWRSSWLGVLIISGNVLMAQDAVVSSLGRPIDEARLGTTLLSELNCVACHDAPEAVRGVLGSKQAPRLGSQGVRLTPQFIREYLLDPHGVGQGRTMPDVLHGVAPANKAVVVDELVHFLMAEQGDDEEVSVGLDEFKLEKGRQLYHSVGCVACHQPQESVKELATSNIKAPEFTGTLANRFAGHAVPMGDLTRKTSVSELASFLHNPLQSRPSGRMPSLGLTPSEAQSIAMYLLRGQATALFDPNQSLEKTRGLKYSYFEFGQNPDLSADGNEDFIEHYPGNLPQRFHNGIQTAGSGVCDEVGLDLARRGERFGLLFSGSLTIGQPGDYTFYVRSDDGSRLYLGSELVVNNSGDHGPQERSGKVTLTAGDHPLKISYYNAGGGGELLVSYEGPGISKQEIPSELYSYLGQPMVPLGNESFAVDVNKVRRGRDHFVSYGCVQCHETGANLNTPVVSTKRLNQLSGSDGRGCLGAQPSKEAVRYFLREPERAALTAALRRNEVVGALETEQQRLDHSLSQFNCAACHERGGQGGPTIAGAEYFGTTTEVDLGDEGRLPPHLNGVGAKLRSEWTREVLLNGGAVRPYMATRMPQFGEANVGHLPELFASVDDPSPDDSAAPVPLVDAKYGRLLVGTRGMQCITCHTYGKFPSLGIPAIDLTQMTHRLKRSWFREYLIDPASLRPGTRMPSFFPEGESTNEDVFDGDTERQIQALWGFLETADNTNPPDGLVQGRKEIVAENEAVLYRNFIQGSGSRSIGVGYPEKANLSFDAEGTRLAMIWQGPFIDGARHSTGRGQGYEPPLGHNVIMLPEGPPLAYLPDREAAWPETSGKMGGFQFKGYRLDEARRPTFLYRFRNVAIEDFAIATETELDAKLNRKLRFRSPADVSDLWMRVVVGDEIQAEGENQFLVDGRLRLRLTSSEPRPPLVRQQDGRAELLVPVPLRQGEGELEMELIW